MRVITSPEIVLRVIMHEQKGDGITTESRMTSCGIHRLDFKGGNGVK